MRYRGGQSRDRMGRTGYDGSMRISGRGIRGEHGRTFWVAAVALLFLAGGLGTWYLSTSGRGGRGAAATELAE